MLFLKKLKNVINPEKKEKNYWKVYLLKYLKKRQKKFKNVKFLAQGTLVSRYNRK